MNLEDERRLKFDVRLRGRRGWVSEKELEAYEQSLPDATNKIQAADESRDEHKDES